MFVAFNPCSIYCYILLSVLLNANQNPSGSTDEIIYDLSSHFIPIKKYTPTEISETINPSIFFLFFYFIKE